MITSMANPKVKQVVRLKNKSKERDESGMFLAEGFKMFKEAPLDATTAVYLSQESIDSAREDMLTWKKLGQTRYEEVTREVFRKMSDTQAPQGILTVVKQPKYDMKYILGSSNPLLLLLEDLQDPGNLGTILRTGEGAGINAVIMSRNTVDIFNPKAIRATMGSIYRVPFFYVENLENCINSLHKNGIHTYAACLGGTDCYSNLSYHGPTAFLIGNESNGLKDSTAVLAKTKISLPMEGQVESLNAAIASSLLMYEAYRQRR